MKDNTYKRMINQISPSKELVENISLQMKSENDKFKNKDSFRQVIAIAIICICIIVSVPVMAITVPAFNDLLYMIAPEVSQFLQPIELSSESNGIKMEVLAAMNDEDTAVVYLTLQDLTGNRFDNTIDLYNYFIRGYSSFTHEVVNFENKTNTATIRMTANGGVNLNGKKITLNLQSILSNKIDYNNVLLDIDMNEISDAKTILLDMNNIPGGGGNGFDKLYEDRIVNVLKPDITRNNIDDDINFVSISGIGYENGFLHIQTDWKESIDNHGYILLKDEAGNEIRPYANLYFGVDENNLTLYGSRYVEYIYEIPHEELSNYKAYGYFTEDGSYTEGKWKVTFKLNAVGNSSIVKNNLEINDIKIDEFTISTLGIHIVGKQNDIKDLEVKAVTIDGEIIEYNSVITNIEEMIKVKYISNLPVEVENISEIIINGVVIDDIFSNVTGN